MTAIAKISNLPNISSPQTIDWQAIAQAFIAIVGDRYVVRTREELIAYECDGLTSYKQQPAIVVLPLTTAEVSEVVKICDRKPLHISSPDKLGNIQLKSQEHIRH